MRLGYLGLGKMGLGMVMQLKEMGHTVLAYNRSAEPRRKAEKAGIATFENIPALIQALPTPRTVWLMMPNAIVDTVLKEVLPFLSAGDTVIDGGNSFYKDSIRRYGFLKKKHINFLDAGVSGGPSGARHGACVMVGGDKKVYERYQKLFKDISAPDAYQYMGSAGAGHFTKMVHNGIEYGMMQAIAEGFAILKKSKLKIKVKDAVRIYSRKSVIESRLISWLSSAFDAYGEDLKKISGSVAHTGEGEWTVKAGKELNIQTPVITDSFRFRVQSGKKPSYTGKILSALRNQFGGHDIGGQKKI
jgi:6-phosphogluconate dehydrogenase